MLDWIIESDINISHYIAEHWHNAFTDFIFPKITFLGDGGWIWILIAVILLCFKKTRGWGIALGAVLIAELILNDLVLKNLVQRVRPCNEFPELPMLIARPDSYSFPSGHSASSFASAVTIYQMNRKWGIAALVLAMLIAFSRVFLLVHYLSDVLAGALLGAAVSFAVCAALKKFSCNFSKYVDFSK